MELSGITNLKKNIKWLNNRTDPSSAPSTPSYSSDTWNENTDFTSKIWLTAEENYTTIFALDDKPSVIIQNEYAYNPYSQDILISNFLLMKMLSCFKIPEKKYSVTAQGDQIFLSDDDAHSFEPPPKKLTV